jgi:hypothetical protein
MVGLIVGGAVAAANVEPEVRTKTVTETVTEEVTPDACLDVIRYGRLLGRDNGKAFLLMSRQGETSVKALEATSSGDVLAMKTVTSLIEADGREGRALYRTIMGHLRSFNAAAEGCESAGLGI